MEIDRGGADRMRAIGRDLKELGDKGLKREFSRALTRTVQPLKDDLPDSAERVLPHRGGLGRRVARLRFRVIRKANGGVRVTASHQYQIERMDDPGVVRHPAFQRRGEEHRRVVWVSQRITPGWFTRPAEALRPQLRTAMLEAAEDMAARIDGRRS